MDTSTLLTFFIPLCLAGVFGAVGVGLLNFWICPAQESQVDRNLADNQRHDCLSQARPAYSHRTA